MGNPRWFSSHSCSLESAIRDVDRFTLIFQTESGARRSMHLLTAPNFCKGAGMKFLVGLILGLAIIPAGLYFYFSTGSAPVATSAQAMPFEKRLAKMALDARVHKEAPTTASLPVNDANLVAGAQVYQQQCAVCHGLPGQQITAIAKGMFPKPPQLFHGKGVTDDPPGETYWKAANGIRLTGMPAFKSSLSDTELWQVSLLLANADKLPAPAQTALGGATQKQANEQTPSPGSPPPDSHRKKS